MQDQELDTLDPRKYIVIKNARVNNLKNLSVAIPRNKLVVITGVSGSGKSSLAFDTLFAEGQRMYVESLNSYARQFLGRMEKPDVDYIKGISPAIAIEQKVSTRNPRSTVGTTTEIYDYLKLLYARIGRTYSPVSGTEVKKDSVGDVVDWIWSLGNGARISILSPIKPNTNIPALLNLLIQKGFTRIWTSGTLFFIEDLLSGIARMPGPTDSLFVLIDRVVLDTSEEDNRFRLSDSVQTAFYEGEGACQLITGTNSEKSFSTRFELDGITFEEPNINLFAFNNPYGACKRCEGFGQVLGIDEDKVIPNKSLSVYEGAIAPWKGEKMGEWLSPLVKNAIKFDFPIHRAYSDLSDDQKSVIWTGNKYFEGLDSFFRYLESQTYKIQYRVMLSRYRGRTNCPDCKGTRLRKDAQYVKIAGKSITDIVLMSITEALSHFQALSLSEFEKSVSQRILIEIINRLGYLDQVGLGYLTLNRLTNTLSGGEFQRIKLATSLGSALVGSLYVLDEPSIGLHPRDTEKLVGVLRSLRDLGNTVIVVEHEEEVMRASDQIIDIGPDAGRNGGKLVLQADTPLLLKNPGQYGTGAEISHTLEFLSGRETAQLSKNRKKTNRYIELKSCRENNLKNINVRFPLGIYTVVTGVSGSGKSSLIKKILYPALTKAIGGVTEEFTGKYENIAGNINDIKQVEFVDQNPIGKSSRSNPVTYTKSYEYIRNLYADQPLAKQRGYKPAHFSFNVEGGRCETCMGEGVIKVEMQFMADIYLTCEGCKGKRFKQEMLEVLYRDKTIFDILEMTVDDALEFFTDKIRLTDKLKPLQEVGLGYIKLGQSSSTLSGGEAQRVKLATYLGEGRSERNGGGIFFLFDEPTTGLHFHDISKLLTSIQALVDLGNTVVVIEHNMDMIRAADWMIDLGPEGGDKGGEICFEGTPEQIKNVPNNHTARFLYK